MSTLIDLTRPLEHIPIDAFPDAIKPLYRIISPEIEYVEHGQGAGIMQAIFGCQKSDLPEGEGWAEENITFSTHLGTHVDAPWHYGSKTGTDEAITVDQIPLEELFLDGVVLDMTHLKGSGKAINVSDIKSALAKIDYSIKDKDAVLLRTDHDKFAITDPLRYNYPGLTAESAKFIADSGATVGGTDALGWDRPFHVMIQEYQSTGDKNKIWDAHYALRSYRFFVVQQMANLDRLPDHGFKVALFPLKIKGASAAPARVVAFVN